MTKQLKEREVSKMLGVYFQSKHLEVLGKIDLFNHPDDAKERSFVIDLAIGPHATKGGREIEQVRSDQKLFEEHSPRIDEIINDLSSISLFPGNSEVAANWSKQPNPNPVVGIAIEIENSLNKYFLGSLLAASIAGRWGVVIVPDCSRASPWIATLNRMIYKGQHSPIPSNILILPWPELSRKLGNS